MTKEIFKFHPIGGLGKIGANMVIVESANDSVIIDCGILFPKESNLGINFLIPNFYESIKGLNISKLIITHGHEDHIGAIAFLLKAIPNLEICAPTFAIGLIRKKLDEKKISTKITKYDEQSVLEFADFKVSPIRVEHSIPDTYGLIFTDKHQIFDAIYISDYKFDQDLSTRILNKCKSKSRVLFSDSTNVLSNKKTLTEAEIITELSDQINKDGRTFITCFASNTFRLQSILDIAKEQGKRVVLHGRSLHFYSKQAIENNLLIDHGKVLREVASIDPEAKNLIVVLTGCQGEFRGTLRRVSFNDDSVFKITENDKFIFSSKTIPGNEFTVTTILNTLSEQNIPVITAEDAKVHASGHISGDELLQFYKELGPDFIIPIHGESFFLRRHVQMINDSTNGPKAIYLSNGDRLILKDDNTCTALSNEEDMPILINGEFSELNRDALSERRKAAETGTVFVSINFESIAKKRPKLSISSLGLCKEGVGVLEDLNTFLVSFLRSTKIKSKDKTTEEIRIVIRRFFIPHIGLRPMAIVHFI